MQGSETGNFGPQAVARDGRPQATKYDGCAPVGTLLVLRRVWSGAKPPGWPAVAHLPRAPPSCPLHGFYSLIRGLWPHSRSSSYAHAPAATAVREPSIALSRETIVNAGMGKSWRIVEEVRTHPIDKKSRELINTRYSVVIRGVRSPVPAP